MDLSGHGAETRIMKEFFGFEGGFFRFMDKLGNLFWLNLLCLICCIPVVTAGASITACYYVALKMVRDEDCYITKDFFRSFRLNLRQATGIWIIFLFLGAFFVLDYRIVSLTGPDGSVLIPFGNLILIVLLTVSFIGIMVLTYVFPVLAKFDNTIGNTLQNAFVLSIRHLPKTLILVLINILFPAVPVLCVWFGRALWLIPLVICFGIAGAAYFCSMIFVGIFDLYSPKKEEQKRETEPAEGGTESSPGEEAEETGTRG